MFKLNFKIAWRNLLKDKQFTLLNVLGLSAGLVCTLLIYLWVSDELSYDKFLAQNDRIYQIMEYRKSGGPAQVSDESSGIVSDLIRVQYPEASYSAALAPPDWFQKFTLTAGDKNIKAIGQYAGQDYFNIFSFTLLSGDRNKVLENKNSIVISDELALKLFGTTKDILGRAIRFQHDTTFFVSGVFEKVPVHSSQQFDFVLSFEYYATVQPWVKSWHNTGPHNFILLRKGIDVQTFNKKLSKLAIDNFQDTTRIPYATKFSDNYLLNTFSHGVKVGGRMEYVKLFSLIAIIILGIACINFMNLSTAKAARRLKEVGIKKVVGAARKQLIFQFLSESLLLTIIAMIIALFLTWSLLPVFNQLTAKQIELKPDLNIMLAVVCIILFTGPLAGSYPALYLSKFNPLAVLKGKLKSSLVESFTRKGLVVFQFTLSSVLIVAVVIIYQQIQFIQSTNPGYSKDNVVRFDSEGSIQGHESDFIAQLKKIPGVVNASFTFNNMVGRNFGTTSISWTGKDPNSDIYFEGFGAGYDFIETMDMRMKEGRSFSNQFGDEYSKVILNEAAVKVMQLDHPVGQTITLFEQPRQVIGVVKDFHFESLHEPVKPAYFSLQPDAVNPWYKLMVRIKWARQKETIDAIEQLYESYNPGFPFSYNFLDEAYEKQYETESRVSTLSKYFAGLAILISCLGLFGLAAFTAQKRQKEIGIRKAIGATAGNITAMLSFDFLKLVGIALLLSLPISWWVMSNWLQGFAYRIPIQFSVFFITAIAVIAMTLLTIGYQAIKAALANPVKSLRTE